MKTTKLALAAFALAGSGTLLHMARPGRAADHIDAPATSADPTADITDLYAWTTPDATKVNLVLNVHHNAPAAATFSTAVVYVFHVSSMASYGASDTAETQIRCKFFSPTQYECWAGAEYVTAAVGANAASGGGKMQVFAGRRNDPFFFELVGFQETVKKVVAAAPSLTSDANGCPMLDAPTATLLQKQLQSSGAIASTAESKPAMDTFAGLNVLSLVVQLDKAVVATKGPVLAVWATTHRAS